MPARGHYLFGKLPGRVQVYKLGGAGKGKVALAVHGYKVQALIGQAVAGGTMALIGYLAAHIKGVVGLPLIGCDEYGALEYRRV